MESYYLKIASGDRNVAASWDDYLDELKSTGLEEYTVLISKYPVTNG
jgi:hypothetical protein